MNSTKYYPMYEEKKNRINEGREKKGNRNVSGNIEINTSESFSESSEAEQRA